MLEDIESMEIVADDILVWGENEQQHDARLIQVLERARLHNLKLNKAKCQLKRHRIAYLGYILTSQGLHPDMPLPQEKEVLQCSFSYANLPLKIYFKSLPPLLENDFADTGNDHTLPNM